MGDNNSMKQEVNPMKRYITFVMLALLTIALCSCTQKDLADMTTGDGDGYVTIASE